MSYLLLKSLHLTTVLLSICGFVVRFAWRVTHHPWSSARMTRILPHVNDSLLLFSGLAMAAMIGEYPLTTPWLTAKLFWLIAYIVAGSFALKRATTRTGQWFAFALAVGCVTLLVGCAIHRSPWSWLAPFWATN